MLVLAELVLVELVTSVVPLVEVEVAAVLEDEPEPLPPPERVPVKVLLIGPHLMLEYVTDAPGEFASTSAGTPDEALQEPRLTPGVEGDLVGG